MSTRTLTAVAALVLGALTWIAFGGSLDGEFVWDDRALLLEHGRWIGFSGESLEFAFTTYQNGHWQPLSWLSWTFDHARSGFDTSGYHATNLVLHALNGVLVLLLGRAIFGRLLPGVAENARLAAAFLVAAIWVAHPLRVESVAWITERRDLLSSLFLFASLLAWWKSRATETLERGWYALAIAMYALSLGAKAWGITLPAVLIVLAIWPLGRLHRGTWTREALLLFPFALLAGITAKLAIWAQAGSGAMEFAGEMSFAQQSAQAARGLVFYPWKTLAPLDLSPLYLLDKNLDATAPLSLGAFGLVTAITTLALVAARRNPAPLVAWIVFGIVVSPVLGFAQSGGQAYADRYSYLSTIPLLLLAAGALLRFFPKPRALAGVALSVALACAFGARRYVPVWQSDVTLWMHAVELDPTNRVAISNRGAARFRRQDIQGARADFDRALELDAQHAMAWYQRSYLRAGAQPVDLAGALSDLDEALRLDPEFAKAYANRGGIRVGLERYGQALPDLDRALEFGEDTPDVRFLRGFARSRAGDPEGAREDLERALEAAPPGWLSEQQARALLDLL